jgi:hypothetical protein
MKLLPKFQVLIGASGFLRLSQDLKAGPIVSANAGRGPVTRRGIGIVGGRLGGLYRRAIDPAIGGICTRPHGTIVRALPLGRGTAIAVRNPELAASTSIAVRDYRPRIAPGIGTGRSRKLSNGKASTRPTKAQGSEDQTENGNSEVANGSILLRRKN